MAHYNTPFQRAAKNQYKTDWTKACCQKSIQNWTHEEGRMDKEWEKYLLIKLLYTLHSLVSISVTGRRDGVAGYHRRAHTRSSVPCETRLRTPK